MSVDIYDVWFTAAFGVATDNAQRICQLGLTPKEIYEMRDSLDFYPAFTDRQQKDAVAVSLADVEKRWAEYEKRNVESVNFTSPDFPKRMTGFENMPLVLYYKGDLSLLSAPNTVAIVGSRQCNGEGERASQLIAAEIALQGGIVVSGLAQGVDTHSHKACTDAGGRTIAFLGTPVTQPYPKRNEAYQHYLEKEHLVVSEFIAGTRYYKTNFITRNRLIRAACDALCVVQATFRSGSLATVNRAFEMGKTVWAVPGSIFSEFYEGSNNLLYTGKAKSLFTGYQVMESLGDEKSRGKTRKPYSERRKELAGILTKEELQVLDSIDGSAFSSDIIKNSGLLRNDTRTILSELEVKGCLLHTKSGEYIKI